MSAREGSILWYRAFRDAHRADTDDDGVMYGRAHAHAIWWRVAISNLGAALRDAGALCASYERGVDTGREAVLSTCEDEWHPGCGWSHDEEPPFDPGYDDPCVRDDSTECDCSRCMGRLRAWEAEQGWHDQPESGEG